MQQVLQVSAKLSEGGAAGVARTLADELRRSGVRSPFAYGYGRNGRASQLEGSYDGVRITPGAIAALNRTSYRWRGAETRLRSGRHWKDLARAAAASDVIHLHILHSYFADTAQMVELLKRAQKPVVWTMHDQWMMTGRCAQPGSCTLWRDGCVTCPDLNAYPPARVDHAAERWIERRAAIFDLQNSVPTAIVACATWLADEARVAGLENVSTITNSVDREFWRIVNGSTRSSSEEYRNLFICRDLRDDNKVSLETLNSIALLSGQSLTVMGDEKPEELHASRHIPATGERASIAQVMLTHDRLIFTSKVDYYPLTIAEAICAGMEVLAVRSPAAEEFNEYPNVQIAETLDDLVSRAGLRANRSKVPIGLMRQLAPERMVEEYSTLYRRLVTGSVR